MDQTLTDLLEALSTRAWYPFAAIGLTLLIAIGKRVAPFVWDRIPQAWQWVPIVAAAGAGAFVEAWSSGVGWQAAMGLALYTALFGGMAGIGTHHTGKRVIKKLRKLGHSPTLPSLLALIVAVPLLNGCAGSYEEARFTPKSKVTKAAPRDSDRCRSLDDQRRWWGGAAKGSAALAGSSGLAIIPSQSTELDTALAIGTGVSAAVAAAAVWLSESAAESWARECR